MQTFKPRIFNQSLFDKEPRDCGDCALCCKLFAIEEKNDRGEVVFDKPANHWCSACRPGAGGCSIYSKRPQPCRTFRCGWLDGLFPRGDRPDHSHVVAVKYRVTDPDTQQIHEISKVLEREPGAHLTPRARATMAVLLQNADTIVVDPGPPRELRVLIPRLNRSKNVPRDADLRALRIGPAESL